MKSSKLSNTKIFLTILIVYLLAGSLAFAKDYQLDKKEFLDMLDKGRITLEKSPITPGIPPELVKYMIEQQKKEFPGFKDEMYYAGYVDTNDYRYFIFYEWFGRGCVFGSSHSAAFRKVTDQTTGGKMAEKENSGYESIDHRYCEKVLGITIPERALPRISGASKVKDIKTKKKEK